MSSYDVVMIRRGEAADSPSPVTIHGLPVWEQLAERLETKGHRFVVGMDRVGVDRPVVLLWDFGSVARLPRKLLARAQGRIVAWCLESPLVAHRAFHRIDAIARDSEAVLTFPGARELLRDDRRVRFYPVMYPISDLNVDHGIPWAERRFMTMINSNKSVTRGFPFVDSSNPIGSARRGAAAILARSYAFRGSWTVPDLYAERVQALVHFSRGDDFDLFGRGWEESVPGLSTEQHERVIASYGGVAGPKREVLRRYRFCLCFENTAFPGYITEKIFDCFAAGTIPVYLGAPDILDHVPISGLVDVSQFRDLGELEGFLRAMSPVEAETRLQSVQALITSDGFAHFRATTFVERMHDAVVGITG